MARKKKQTEPAHQFNPNAFEERKAREHKLLESVGYRKVRIEDIERMEREAKERELEREANELLRKDMEAIREGLDQLLLPSNDPHRLAKLKATQESRDAIANQLTQVDIVPDGNKSYLGVGSFQHHEALDLARKLADHFELKIRQHE